ncbi:MAG TPA: FGGY family carbohydrate kinase [Ilumatobacteraceae bacterium]
MILVIDVGTTSMRAAVVDDEPRIRTLHPQPFPPSTPHPGLVEFDAAAMGMAVLDLARAALAAAGGTVTAIGITAQRASTVVWDAATGEPVAPGLGWQDLRTVGECIMAKAEHGLALAPNQSATKIAWILANVPDLAGRDLRFGTVDSWVAHVLSGGELHVTDHTNAAVTGLYDVRSGDWNARTCEILGIPMSMLPRIVDTIGEVGTAHALAGDLPIAALAGDQQASLVGQGCVQRGAAKITFGTGGMLDMCAGEALPASANRDHHGTFPIVAWSREGVRTFGVEAVMLSAGTNVEWLRDDLGLLATAAESHDVASQCETTDGVVYVPALLGLGTPAWDYGARGGLFGVTRGTDRSHVVRAVLEGVAHRGADLVEAAEADTGVTIPALRVDGGMSENPTFVRALAAASGKRVEVSPVVEATTIGAAYLAGIATGLWADLDAVAASWRPSVVIEPDDRLDRERWAAAVTRASEWIPELSALDF